MYNVAGGTILGVCILTGQDSEIINNIFDDFG